MSSTLCEPLKRTKKKKKDKKTRGATSKSGLHFSLSLLLSALFLHSWGHGTGSAASFRIDWFIELEILWPQSLKQEPAVLSHWTTHTRLVEVGVRKNLSSRDSMRTQVKAFLNKVERWWHLVLLPKAELWFHVVLYPLPFNFRFLIDWAPKTLHLYLLTYPIQLSLEAEYGH